MEPKSMQNTAQINAKKSIEQISRIMKNVLKRYEKIIHCKLKVLQGNSSNGQCIKTHGTKTHTEINEKTM